MRTLSVLIFALTGISAFAAPAAIEWPTRGSKVVCGGLTESGDLTMRVSSPDGLLAAESEDGRILLYIDLSKPGRVKWMIAELMTDPDYEARQELIKKLTPEEANLIIKLSAKHVSEIYSGFTDGYVHLYLVHGDRVLSVSCQESASKGGTKPGFPTE